MATDITVIPSSNDAFATPWTGDGYTAIDDPIGSPDDNSTYIYNGNTGNNGCTFGVGSANVPVGCIVNYVRVCFRAYDFGAQSGSMTGRIKVGGNYYNDSYKIMTGSYANYYSQWNNNPKTGVAWTRDDVNAVGANAVQAVGVYAAAAGSILRCTQCYLLVNYTASSGVAYTMAGSGILALPGAFSVVG